MSQPPLGIEKRLLRLPRDPCRRVEAHVIRPILRHTRAHALAHAVAAADGDRDPRAQPQMVGRLLGEPARNRAGGAERREFIGVQAEVLQHIVVVIARLQVHEPGARRIRKITRVHITCQAINKIVLALQEFYGFLIGLGFVFLQPHSLGEREVRGQDVAGNPVEIVCAELLLQRPRYVLRARIAPDHCRAKRLPIIVHRQKAQHLAGNADRVNSFEVFRHELAKHKHRAHRAHPPVGRVLLYAAVWQIVRRIGGGHVSQNIQSLIDERGFQAACADVEDQQNRLQGKSLHIIYIESDDPVLADTIVL